MSNDRTQMVTQVVAPSFLANYAGKKDTSLANLREYRILSTLKIVQGNSTSALKAVGPERSVVMLPGLELLIPPDGGFNFTPVFAWASFRKERDNNDKTGAKTIEEVFYAQHPIAIRARKEETRREIYPGDEKKAPNQQQYYQYNEYIHFAGVIYGEINKVLTPVALSFKGGEFQTGKNFSTKIQNRKLPDGDTAPLWSQVWRFFVEEHKSVRNNKTWWGFGMANPENPYIRQEEVEPFLALHEELKKLHESRSLGIDNSGDDMDIADGTPIVDMSRAAEM